MPYYAIDRSLSLETRGAAAALLSVGKTTFTVQDIRDAGASKATAYRILGELRANGYVEKGGGHTWQWLKSYPVSGNPEIRKTGIRTTHIDHDLDTRSSDVVRFSEFPENEHDFNHSSDDGPELEAETPVQTTLTGLSGAPTPVPAPPSPKPKRDRTPKRTPEEVALDEALAEVCGLDLNAISRPLRLGLIQKRKALQKAGATVERIRAIAAYWRSAASPAARMAAKEQRAVSPPSLEQVGQHYRQAQEWHDAQEAQRERDAAAAREREQRGILVSPEEQERARAVARRGFLAIGPAVSAQPALVARGRNAP